MIMEAALADIKELADFINTSKKEAQLQIDVVRVYRLLKPSIPVHFENRSIIHIVLGFGFATSKVHSRRQFRTNNYVDAKKRYDGKSR